MNPEARMTLDLAKRLEGEVAIITGGAGGIGRAVATRLACEGAAVAILDVNGTGAREIAAGLSAGGRQALPVTCNVTKRNEVRSALDAVLAKFGRLTILVNNAGIVRRAPFLDLSDEMWADVLDVNLTAAFIVAQESARVMAKQGFGRIVNMASVAAVIAHGNLTAYSISKAGIEAMTRTMAFDLAPFGVNVNAVAPGTIATGFALGPLSEEAKAGRMQRIPLGRFGEALDVAAAVAFLASSDAAYITGTVLTVDGGLVMGGVRDRPS
jgi:NAD(P)-dependent dehydrogenase (short-subunit alcohol dehydrogenase family)